MAQQRWTLDDIPWDRFDQTKVDRNIVSVVKAAALVEFNAAEYAAHLRGLFAENSEFQASVGAWSSEEVLHGTALGRWCSLADPSFDFNEAVGRFRRGYQRPEALGQGSVRGTLCGELVARCIVETGTSSFYSAIGDAVEEPVLRFLCKRIAADEFRHYKLFFNYLKHQLDLAKVGKARLLQVAVRRIVEIQDDELAYAYHAANDRCGVYNRKLSAGAYEYRAFGLYQSHHVHRAVGMTLKACGLNPQTWWGGLVNRASWWLLQSRVRRLRRLAQ